MFQFEMGRVKVKELDILYLAKHIRKVCLKKKEGQHNQEI